jgi:MFS transporter, DHA3 family, macrolide efflux protein
MERVGLKLSHSILKNRSFLFFWFAAWVSTLGDTIFTIGVSWMIVNTLKSGTVMGTFLLIIGVVRSIFMLYGGVIVDRLNPMMLMKLSLGFRAVMMVVLALIATSSVFTKWELYALAAFFGFVDAFFLPSAAAARQRLVTEEYFTQANSLLLVASQVSVIVGPVIGAFLIKLGGMEILFGTFAFAFVLALVLLRMIRLLPVAMGNVSQSAQKKRKFGSEFREGLQYVFRTPIILTSIFVAMLVNAGISVLTVSLPFLSVAMKTGVAGLGMMNSGLGVGGALGAIVFTLWMIKRPTPQMNLFACLLEGLAVSSIFFVNNIWLATTLLAITGITTTAINVIAPSVNQTIIPKELFGRVISVMMLAMNGSIPISQAASGYLIDHVDVHQVFLYGGLLETLAAFSSFFIPSVRTYGKERRQSFVKSI